MARVIFSRDFPIHQVNFHCDENLAEGEAYILSVTEELSCVYQLRVMVRHHNVPQKRIPGNDEEHENVNASREVSVDPQFRSLLILYSLESNLISVGLVAKAGMRSFCCLRRRRWRVTALGLMLQSLPRSNLGF